MNERLFEDIYNISKLQEAFAKVDTSWIEEYVWALHASESGKNSRKRKRLEKEHGVLSLRIDDTHTPYLQGASYGKDGIITFYFSETAVDYIIRGTDYVIEEIIEQMKVSFVHESTHKHQHSKNDKIYDKYFTMPDDSDYEDKERYITQYQELPAMARAFGAELERVWEDPKIPFIAIFKENNYDPFLHIRDEYVRVFEVIRDSNERTWKKFVKYLYDYLYEK